MATHWIYALAEECATPKTARALNVTNFNQPTDVSKHPPHDNGGAARDWKVLSIRPPLRGATTFHAIASPDQMHSIDVHCQMSKLFARLHNKILTAIFACLLFMGLVWFIQTEQFITSWDFRNNLWAPSYLLLHGASPYRISVLFDNSGAVWFPVAIGLFFPLGLLPEYQATNLWLVANVLLLVILIWLANDVRLPSPIRFGFSLGLVFLFPPTLSHLILGQYTILTTVLLLLATRFARQSNVFMSGFLLAVSLTKPQLMLLAIPGIFFAVSVKRGLRAIVRLGVTISLFALLLTAPLWFAYPSWYNDFIVAQQSNPSWLQPSLPTFIQINFGFSRFLVWSFLALIVFAANIWIWLKLPANRAILWSLSLTPIASPYIWSWDFILLLPLVINALNHLKTKVAVALLALGCILCWMLTVWVRFVTDNSDHLFWWVPYSILLTVCAAYVAEIALGNKFQVSMVTKLTA